MVIRTQRRLRIEINLTPVDASIKARSYTGQPNAIEIIIGDLTVWKSYDTIIGFKWEGNDIPGIIDRLDQHIVSNSYSATTGRHQNWIDGGTIEAKIERVDKKTFDYLLGSLMKSINLIKKDMKLGDY